MVTDSLGVHDTYSYSINILAALTFVTPTTLPNATVNTPYNQTLVVSGGTEPYRFGFRSGALPSGLTLSSGGLISGTPTAAGNSTFTVSAADRGDSQVNQTFTLQVLASGITLAPTTLPNPVRNALYNQGIAATGGTPPYSFAVTSGTLPIGLTLSTAGILSGTATTLGSSSFTITATDSANIQGSQPFTLQVQSTSTVITFTPTTLASGAVNVAYSQTLTVTGGVGPYQFAVTSGALPSGLALSTSGVLSGTPTSQGSSAFTVTVTDSAGATGSQNYTLSISPAGTGQPQPISPTNTFAMPNAALPVPLVARIVNLGNAVSGVPVTWTVIQGGGTLSGQTLTSDANGLVQTNYKMGPGPQDNIVRITVTASGAFYDFVVRNQETAVITPAKQIIAPQAQIAMNTPLIQLNNIQVHLDNQRLLRNPTVMQGLKVSYNGQPLPALSLLALAQTDKDGNPAPQTGGGASPDTDPFARFGGFIQGDIDVGKQSGTNGTQGFDVRTNGLTIGVDYRFPGNHVLGAAVGLMKAKTDLTDNAGDQNAKGYSISLFGEYVPVENAYVDLAMNIGRNKYDGKRRVADSTGEYNSNPRGNQFGIALSAGYQFYRQSLTLTPYGRVEYVDASIDSFQESGAPDPLQVDSQRYKSTVLSAGGQAQYAISTSWGVLVPYARVEYQYTAQNSAKQVNAQLVGLPSSNTLLPSVGADKSYGNVGLGATAVLPRGMSGYFNYQHLFGKQNFDDDRYILGVRIEF